MNREFEYLVTQESFCSVHRGMHKNTYDTRARFFIYMPLALALAVVILGTIFTVKILETYNIGDSDVVAVTGLFIMSAGALLTILIWRKIYVPYIQAIIASRSDIGWKDYTSKIAFDDKGMTITYKQIQTYCGWADMNRIIDNYGFVFFYSGQFAFFVPSNTFNNETEKRDFIEECRAKMKQARDEHEKK
jgi:hypothetical protein